MKKYLVLVLVVLIILGYVLSKKETVLAPVVENSKPISLCFYAQKLGVNGLSDVAWLKMNLLGDKVTGEFRNIPGEKDKKVGTFEGTVSKVDPYMMGRTADVWWNSMAEGMQVKEQLKITFGEGNAQAGYGEMVDRGDGVYVYKNPDQLTYGISMTDVACDDVRLAE